MNYLDLHTHILKETYDKNYDKVLMDFISEKNAKAINVSLDLNSAQENINLAKKYKKHFKAAIGIHPSHTNEAKINDIKNLSNLIKNNLDVVIAIGETGLNLIGNFNLSVQKNFFIEHLKLALKHNLPLIIHTRQANQETYELLNNFKSEYNSLPKLIFHSWTGTPDWTKKILSLHNEVFFSFSGIVTFKNAQEIFDSMKIVPLNKIFYETDCPWLAPVPFRGKENIPKYSKTTGEFIAKNKGYSFEDFNKRIKQNFIKVFKNERWINES